MVDRFEGPTAIIVGDDGTSFEVARNVLPKTSKEGTVLRVDQQGPPDWARASIDHAERERRIARARADLNELKKSDPGGDVKL